MVKLYVILKIHIILEELNILHDFSLQPAATFSFAT
jgi:hypothetical protein